MSSFYTVRDVAAMSGLSVRTIRSCLASGKLLGEKVDGAWITLRSAPPRAQRSCLRSVWMVSLPV